MIPDQHLAQTAVFHITHVDNLAGMLAAGGILAKNLQTPGNCQPIANEEVQSRRARILVPLPPGGPLEDYVPFYFAPRSPLLFCNHNGRIPNATPQNEIIHLVTTAQNIRAAGRSFVFYDRHAVVAYARAFNRLEDLKQIDWRVFFEAPLIDAYARCWQNQYDDRFPHWVTRQEVRQAEFFVHQWLPSSSIRLIGTNNSAIKARVEELLNFHGSSCDVEIRSDWYFTK